MSLVRLSHTNGLKMHKISKNYKQLAKTQIIEVIKVISYYLNIMYPYFIFFTLIQLKLYRKNKEVPLDHIRKSMGSVITRMC